MAISRIRFRIQHFRTHLVTCHSWKPWQHSRRREARLLPRGVDEHKRKIPKKTKEFNSIKSIKVRWAPYESAHQRNLKQF